MSLVITPGAVDATSYVSVAQATAYYARRANSGKFAALASAALREEILANATMDVDRELAKYVNAPVLIDQLLIYPWYEWTHSLSPDSGSTTSAVSSSFALQDWSDDYFVNGSIFVGDADEAAPEHELELITDYVRSTGTFTTDPFTAAIDQGDSLILIEPAPPALRNAVCEQAIFLLEDKHVETANDLQSGVQSRSDIQGGSVSYQSERAEGDILSAPAWDALQPIIRQIRSPLKVVRG